MGHEILEKWDNGQTIWSIEMGGLGPGYEQALQVAAVESLRCLNEYADAGNVIPEDRIDEITEPGLSRVQGLSGAQAGAAKFLAYKWLMLGEQGAKDEARQQGIEEDRFIQVSNNWPQAEG